MRRQAGGPSGTGTLRTDGPAAAPEPEHTARDHVVRVFRRAIVALVAAGMIAAALRVRGRGGVPPQGGGWQELPVSDPG